MEEFQEQKSKMENVKNNFTSSLVKTAISKYDYPCKWCALIDHFQWRIQGRGPDTLIFRPKWGLKGRKKFFWRRGLPHLRVPPLIWRSGSAIDFWVLKTLTWKMKPSAQPFLWVNEFYFHENKKTFSYQRLRTQPRFDTGLGELGNDLLAKSRGLPISCRISIIVQTTKKINITFHCPRLSPGISPMNIKARGLWVWVADLMIREAQKRVQTKTDKKYVE